MLEVAFGKLLSLDSGLDVTSELAVIYGDLFSDSLPSGENAEFTPKNIAEKFLKFKKTKKWSAFRPETDFVKLFKIGKKDGDAANKKKYLIAAYRKMDEAYKELPNAQSRAGGDKNPGPEIEDL